MILLSLAVGCSVKEDRSVCPVVIRFSERVNPFACTGGALVTIDGGWGSRDMTIPVDSLGNGRYEILSSKGYGSVSVIVGAGNALVDRGYVKYPDGLAPDCIFALSEDFYVDGRDEVYVVRDSLCRQVAFTMMRIEGFDGEPFPYTLRLRSEWNGFDRSSLEPLSGGQAFSPVPMEEPMRYSVFIPRQGDASLILEFVSDGEVKYEYPLGEKISEYGYDWTEKNLKSLDMDVDCSCNEISVEIRDWNDYHPVEYTI